MRAAALNWAAILRCSVVLFALSSELGAASLFGAASWFLGS